MSDEQSLQIPTDSDRVTLPAWRYFKEEHELTSFFDLVNRGAHVSDPLKLENVAEVIRSLPNDDIAPEIKTAAVRTAAYVVELMHHGRLVAQMQLTRLVDNFLSYISELLTLVFRTKPDTLRTDESSVTLSYIMHYGTMDDLIGALSEKRVNELAYKGVPELSKYLAKRIGFELYVDEERMAQAVTIVEQRNLVVHNRGVVNTIFASRQPAYAPRLGKPLKLSVSQVVEYQKFMLESVIDIDSRASAKFDLERASDWTSVANLPKPHISDW